MRSNLFRFIAAAAVTGLLVAPGASLAGKPAAKPLKNIVQTAREAGSFTTLIAALEATDLVGTLSGQGKGPFTVFAPTDEAFAKLPAGTVESLLADPEALKKILLYHLVAGDYRAAQVGGLTSVATVNGQSLSISASGGVKVNDANVVLTDVLARNGVLHVIDTVLLPQ